MPIKNIIILNDYAFINGGASKVALVSALGLAKLGYSVTILCSVGPILPELINRPNLSVVSTDQQEILTNTNRIEAVVQGLWNNQSRRALQYLLKNLDPLESVIHLHGWTKALSSSIVRTVLQMNFPIVCTMHDYFLACPNGAFYNYPKGQICHLKALSIPCLMQNCDVRNYSQKIWRYGRSLIERNIGGLPTELVHFIAVSNFSQAIMQSYLPKTARIHRIDNPIDLPKMIPAKVHENCNFVAVGRVAKEKGSDLFAEASTTLGISALFVGDGPFREAVTAINPSAKVTGWLAYEKVIGLMKSARALVFSSVLYESQGLVVLEAAACGVPAIISDATAAREFVVNGETGLWFKSGDIHDLQAKISQLLDKEFARKMGQAAYDRYWGNPNTLDKHLEDLQRVYSEVVRQ